MKTKFVRILSVLLAIAMLAACSVIVSATGSSLDSKLGLVGEYDKNSKIVKISLVYSGEVCYNVEGNWGDILDENGNTADGFTLNNIEFNNAVVDGLNDMYVGNKITGNASWVDMKFDNTATNGTIMTAEYTVDDSVQPGKYRAEFTTYVYTGGNKTPVEFDIGEVVYVEFEIEEDEPDEPQGTLRGDINLDEVVDMLDFVALARHIGEVEFISKPDAQINADVNGDEVIDMLDFVKLAQYVGEVISDLE